MPHAVILILDLTRNERKGRRESLLVHKNAITGDSYDQTQSLKSRIMFRTATEHPCDFGVARPLSHLTYDKRGHCGLEWVSQARVYVYIPRTIRLEN